MKKTLITGATGSLGQLVVNELTKLADKSSITVLVRDPEAEVAKNYKTAGYDVRVGTYDDPKTLATALEGIQQVYLISGNDLEARTQQHKNVIDAAAAAGVENIVYTSAGRKDESEAAPLYPVVSGHKATEEAILSSGLTYTILRHNLYSEVVPMFIGEKAQLLESKTIYLPTGTGKAAYASRADLAEAAAKILANAEAHQNKTYEFNGSENVSFEEIAQYISAATGETIQYVSPEVDEFEKTMASYGLPEAIVGMLSMFSQGIAAGEFEKTEDDLEQILGRKTQSMEDFLQEVYS